MSACFFCHGLMSLMPRSAISTVLLRKAFWAPKSLRWRLSISWNDLALWAIQWRYYTDWPWRLLTQTIAQHSIGLQGWSCLLAFTFAECCLCMLHASSRRCGGPCSCGGMLWWYVVDPHAWHFTSWHANTVAFIEELKSPSYRLPTGRIDQGVRESPFLRYMFQYLRRQA